MFGQLSQWDKALIARIKLEETACMEEGSPDLSNYRYTQTAHINLGVIYFQYSIQKGDFYNSKRITVTVGGITSTTSQKVWDTAKAQAQIIALLGTHKGDMTETFKKSRALLTTANSINELTAYAKFITQ